MILFVVAVSVKVESIVGNNIPIREMVIIFISQMKAFHFARMYWSSFLCQKN